MKAQIAIMMADSVCMASPYFTRSQKWTYPSDSAKNAMVMATKMRSCITFLLPGALLAPEPPDQTQCGRTLVLAEHVLSTGQEHRHVGPVVAILGFHLKAICNVVSVGHRELL